MKKENKELARVRKAAQKKKLEQKKTIIRVSMIVAPCLLFVAFLVFAVNYNRTNVVATESLLSTERTESIVASSSSESTTGYSTDSTLSVADGDTVNIDYVGTIDDVAFDGGNTNGAGADLTIGSNQYIDNFEEQLVGHHVGETVDVTVTFPSDYGVDTLNGKEAVFSVTINGIYQ